MDRKTLVQQARELIADPLRWTTRTLARDANGLRVSPCSSVACQWCADGALRKVAQFGSDVERDKLYYDVRDWLDGLEWQQFGVATLPGLNDRLGHTAVLQLFDAAIAAEG